MEGKGPKKEKIQNNYQNKWHIKVYVTTAYPVATARLWLVILSQKRVPIPWGLSGQSGMSIYAVSAVFTHCWCVGVFGDFVKPSSPHIKPIKKVWRSKNRTHFSPCPSHAQCTQWDALIGQNCEFTRVRPTIQPLGVGYTNGPKRAGVFSHICRPAWFDLTTCAKRFMIWGSKNGFGGGGNFFNFNPPVWHFVWLLPVYGALDSHPFFPSHVASGCCSLAAGAGALAGAFGEPSSWCVGTECGMVCRFRVSSTQ